MCKTYFPVFDFGLKVIVVYTAIFMLKYSISMGGKIFLDKRLEGCVIVLRIAKRRRPSAIQSTTSFEAGIRSRFQVAPGPEGSKNHFVKYYYR